MQRGPEEIVGSLLFLEHLFVLMSPLLGAYARDRETVSYSYRGILAARLTLLCWLVVLLFPCIGTALGSAGLCACVSVVEMVVLAVFTVHTDQELE